MLKPTRRNLLVGIVAVAAVSGGAVLTQAVGQPTLKQTPLSSNDRARANTIEQMYAQVQSSFYLGSRDSRLRAVSADSDSILRRHGLSIPSAGRGRLLAAIDAEKAGAHELLMTDDMSISEVSVSSGIVKAYIARGRKFIIQPLLVEKRLSAETVWREYHPIITEVSSDDASLIEVVDLAAAEEVPELQGMDLADVIPAGIDQAGLVPVLEAADSDSTE